MKFTAAILGLLIISASSQAEIVRCHARVPLGGLFAEFTYEIVLPDEGSLGFVGRVSENGDMQKIITHTAGLGIIEVKLNSSLGKPDRHDFVLLQSPRPLGWSLVGFYFSGISSQHPTVVRADLWDDDKPFFVYDSFAPKEIGEGTCE